MQGYDTNRVSNQIKSTSGRIMRIKNKFKVGDVVYYIYKNQVYRNEVIMITTWTLKNGTEIQYTVSGDEKYYEHHLFKSRDELIQAL